MHQFTAAVLLSVLSCATAFPAIPEMGTVLQERVEPEPRAPLGRLNRPNTGLPPTGFIPADQYVDVTDGGNHRFVPPAGSDRRGQCPGLNAAANHGFLKYHTILLRNRLPANDCLSRNGLTTITQAIEGLGAAYNMAPDLAGFLATLAVAISGDPLTETWSIGSAFTPSLGLFPARGILGTHNKYEGDASIMRGDAYLNGGSPGVFQMRAFENMYNMGKTFGFDEAAAQSDYNTRWSVANNPYYFSAPFSGLVAPAAHNLVINLMSNHSAEAPGGTLTRETLMSFFSVTGTPGKFKHNRGLDRIPLNWYRRSTADAHGLAGVGVDLVAMNSIYPGIIRFGGNTGTTNSFTGVDLQSLSSGAYNIQTLAQGNNAVCLLLQASLSGLPDAAAPVLGAVGSVLGWAVERLGPLQQKFACPQLKAFNNDLFNAFPGASYTGTGA